MSADRTPTVEALAESLRGLYAYHGGAVPQAGPVGEMIRAKAALARYDAREGAEARERDRPMGKEPDAVRAAVSRLVGMCSLGYEHDDPAQWEANKEHAIAELKSALARERAPHPADWSAFHEHMEALEDGVPTELMQVVAWMAARLAFLAGEPAQPDEHIVLTQAHARLLLEALAAPEPVWLCAKCGHGSEEHGTPGHPAYSCIADMRLRPATPEREGWKTVAHTVIEDGRVDVVPAGATPEPVQREPDGWRAIETAPKDGTEILGYAQGRVTLIAWMTPTEMHGPHPDDPEIHGEPQWWEWYGAPLDDEPTLWHPLPPAPVRQEEA